MELLFAHAERNQITAACDQHELAEAAAGHNIGKMRSTDLSDVQSIVASTLVPVHAAEMQPRLDLLDAIGEGATLCG